MATEADILKALENLYAPGGVSLAKAVSGVNLSGAKAFGAESHYTIPPLSRPHSLQSEPAST